MVDGGCGAWIPHDQPEMILAEVGGLQPRDVMVSALGAGGEPAAR